MEKHKKEKKKLGLSTKIFIALLTGAVCGVLIHYYMPEGYFRDTILINGILYVLGNGFIRLMQMLVVPLVFCSLVCGAMAIGDTKTLGRRPFQPHRLVLMSYPGPLGRQEAAGFEDFVHREVLKYSDHAQ